jgi:hypothetical protein
MPAHHQKHLTELLVTISYLQTQQSRQAAGMYSTILRTARLAHQVQYQQKHHSYRFKLFTQCDTLCDTAAHKPILST